MSAPSLIPTYSRMTFPVAVGSVFRKYAVFRGRATRSEFWWFALLMFLWGWVVNIVALIIVVPLFAAVTESVVANKGQLTQRDAVAIETSLVESALLFAIVLWVCLLALLLPNWAVLVRRLHDTNRSGWLVLVNFIPFAGPIILFVFTVLPSYERDNSWGAAPVPWRDRQTLPVRVDSDPTDGVEPTKTHLSVDETNTAVPVAPVTLVPSAASQNMWWAVVAGVWVLTPLMWLLLAILMNSALSIPTISHRTFRAFNIAWDNGDVAIAGLAGGLAVVAALVTGRGSKRWWSAFLALLGFATAVVWTLLQLRGGWYYEGAQFVLEPVLFACESGALIGAWILAVGQPRRVFFALIVTVPIGLISAFMSASGSVVTSYTIVGLVGRLVLVGCVVMLAYIPRNHRNDDGFREQIPTGSQDDKPLEYP